MSFRLFLFGSLAVSTLTCLTGCTNVDPLDRNILSKDSMTTHPDTLGSLVHLELEYAREGTEGATGINAGGCGCN